MTTLLLVGPTPEALQVGGGSSCELDRRRLEAVDGPEDDGIALRIDDDRLAGPELLPENLLREGVLDELLDRPTKRTSAERRVVALLRHQLLGLSRQFDTDALRLELLADPTDQEVHDLGDLGEEELVEDDDLVDSVQELGAEVGLERLVAPSPSSARSVTASAVLANPIEALRRSAVPRLDVMINTVFLKSTVRPCASVRRPSSRICSRVLKTSGCAFSISSNSTTENGLRRTASVSWPPSS